MATKRARGESIVWKETIHGIERQIAGTFLRSKERFFFFSKRTREGNTRYMCVYMRDAATWQDQGLESKRLEKRGFRFDSRQGFERSERKIARRTRFFVLSFYIYMCVYIYINVLNPRFQFFRRCPLPWHRRLLSPPLCLLLRFRISVLAFGYLKKSQRKNIKRNSSESRYRISYFLFFLFFFCLFFYDVKYQVSCTTFARQNI